MRNNIVSAGAEELRYEIREIVAVAKEFAKFGIDIIWENIGDPVQKGEKVPDWIKQIVSETVHEDLSYAYSPTKGLDATREFLAEQANKKGNVRITKEDILFFNGLGDAISKIYGRLRKECRVIGPSPAYSTHSSAEAAHAGAQYISYNLDPRNNWYPDLDDLRMKVKYNPAISGILIINPDNPTGAVYPKEILLEIVSIAKEHDLFIVCDEIYTNMAYNGTRAVPLAEVINGICGIAMKGISKELPWPGARCGWIEVYNQTNDPVFAKYVKSILDDKMLEVCSTSLPQKVIPRILPDPRFQEHLQQRNKQYERRSNIAYNLLKDLDGIIVNRTNGAFYMTVMFEEGVLNERQFLKVNHPESKKYVEKITMNVALDKRFVYYLLASTGICIVPLTGFNCSLKGFRITLLESDERFDFIFKTVRDKIKEYLNSAS
ncbi:MAG: pyridoxal phosphate-dependent aminotransferase [Nitrospirota bacterium]